MLDDPPQARVVLAKPLGRVGDRHRLGQRQHVGLEQQREPGARPSPRRGDLAQPARRTGHARHTSVQHRAALTSARGAGEPAPARKIQIEPTILDRKLATRHPPRRLQPKGQLEKIGVSHPPHNKLDPNRSLPKQPKNPAFTQSIQRGAFPPGPPAAPRYKGQSQADQTGPHARGQPALPAPEALCYLQDRPTDVSSHRRRSQTTISERRSKAEVRSKNWTAMPYASKPTAFLARLTNRRSSSKPNSAQSKPSGISVSQPEGAVQFHRPFY